jgi:hypothetical protein
LLLLLLLLLLLPAGPVWQLGTPWKGLAVAL